MKLSSGLKQFVIRIFIFIALFIFVSGVIGPWVIGTMLLFGFYFFIYGNLGKLVIFSALMFLFMTKDRISNIKVPSFKSYQLLFILAAFLLIPVFFHFGRILLTHKTFTDDLLLSLVTHIVLISIPVLLAFGVFGYKFIKSFFIIFKKEFLICTGLSAILFVSIFQVWKLWPYFSALVLNAVYFSISHLYPNVSVIPPRTLFVKNFAVEIGEACSGLESIFLFTVLYIFMAILDWKLLNKTKIIAFYPLLLAGLIFVNILRVFLLLWVGILLNPQIMATLFHTYLGMVLFIIYFLAFLKFGYRWLKRN